MKTQETPKKSRKMKLAEKRLAEYTKWYSQHPNSENFRKQKAKWEAKLHILQIMES